MSQPQGKWLPILHDKMDLDVRFSQHPSVLTYYKVWLACPAPYPKLLQGLGCPALHNLAICLPGVFPPSTLLAPWSPGLLVSCPSPFLTRLCLSGAPGKRGFPAVLALVCRWAGKGRVKSSVSCCLLPSPGHHLVLLPSFL